MIPYNPHRWTSHLFDVRGSMVQEILGRVAVCVLWSTVVTMAHYRFPEWFRGFEFPATGHTLLGVVVGLLLVFRTNSSYDRFWEGRKLWGSLINESRNLGRLNQSLLQSTPEIQQRFSLWTSAFSWATMYRLRNERSLGPIAQELPPDDVHSAISALHPPMFVASQLTNLVNEARRTGHIDSIQQGFFDHNITLLVDYLGGCERIRNTPAPFAYIVHLRRVLMVYCFTLPLALVNDFGWQTIVATLIIAYTMFGIEEIGVEIEDPFGVDSNDLPLEDFCRTIQSNLAELTSVQRSAIEPVNGPLIQN